MDLLRWWRFIPGWDIYWGRATPASGEVELFRHGAGETVVGNGSIAPVADNRHREKTLTVP
ncbi:hypothetical protein [Streptomyces sp. NPDC053560]|uniref:hypothetical protein n=1 Tax=Streptomyces sp. NPDC053560 TaxID=3365711 RepID=UPI0037CDA16C